MLVIIYFLWDPDLSAACAASFQRIWLCTLLINICFIHILEISFWSLKLQSLREGLAWFAYEGFNLGGERALATLSSKEEKVIPNKLAITWKILKVTQKNGIILMGIKQRFRHGHLKLKRVGNHWKEGDFSLSQEQLPNYWVVHVISNS